MDSSSLSSQSATNSGVLQVNGDYITVGEALKLIPPLKGNKQEALAFIGNVDTAFALINLKQEAILYKCVLTCISGKPRTVISHRNLDNWVELKEFLRNSYIEKQTLVYHAGELLRPDKERMSK